MGNGQDGHITDTGQHDLGWSPHLCILKIIPGHKHDSYQEIMFIKNKMKAISIEKSFVALAG